MPSGTCTLVSRPISLIFRVREPVTGFPRDTSTRHAYEVVQSPQFTRNISFHHKPTMPDPQRQPRTQGSPSPTIDAFIVVAMLAMVAIPAALTLHTVRSPGTLAVGANPSPHGYTWSLLLFVVPILVIGLWFLPSEGLEIPQRAFWRTISILVPLGCLP